MVHFASKSDDYLCNWHEINVKKRWTFNIQACLSKREITINGIMRQVW